MRIFQSYRKILKLSQGGDYVAVYFTKLIELWAKYDILVFPNCGCPKSKDHQVHIQQQRMIQFLNGLNDTNDQARRQILMKITKPTLIHAYAMITQDESQQANNNNNIGMNKVDPLALQVGRV